ncbi:hypothetical protein LINPERHAP2_LOCUS22176 [Linum perenne]
MRMLRFKGSRLGCVFPTFLSSTSTTGLLNGLEITSVEPFGWI